MLSKKARPERVFLYANHAKWAAIFLTVLGMVAGAIAWASSEHISLKDFSIAENCRTKHELIDRSEQRYVPRENFTRVETRQQVMIDKIEKIEDEVGDLHDMLIKGKR